MVRHYLLSTLIVELAQYSAQAFFVRGVRLHDEGSIEPWGTHDRFARDGPDEKVYGSLASRRLRFHLYVHSTPGEVG